MKQLISVQTAAKVLLALLLVVIIFHLLVLTGIIPYTIVWGGRLDDAGQMRVFEIVSITVNVLIISVVAIRAGYWRVPVRMGVVRGVLWVFVALFALNTFGNLLAESMWEKVIFTPLTFILALLCWRLALP